MPLQMDEAIYRAFDDVDGDVQRKMARSSVGWKQK